MIKLVDVHKSYTKDKETIKGVSFEVKKGEIFGLLGPNGAGKTTLMQMIATLMKPTSGQVIIDGLTADKDILEIHKRINELSTGMKQKISIAISLIHNPPIIIFDEPTNGLDILTSKQVTDYLKELKEQGHAILLSTHIFSVAEELCDDIAILVDGKIVAQGSVEELVRQSGTETFEKAFFKISVENHKE